MGQKVPPKYVGRCGDSACFGRHSLTYSIAKGPDLHVRWPGDARKTETQEEIKSGIISALVEGRSCVCTRTRAVRYAYLKKKFGHEFEAVKNSISVHSFLDEVTKPPSNNSR